MSAGSDSSRCELDSVTSADSLQIITDEFRLNHLSTPDVSNSELSKRLAALELDNERLRIDLENSRLELNVKNAANQGLKNKIAELYVEVQNSVQERQKLQYQIKDIQCQLVTVENSTKWYQEQMHEVQANKRSLQVEIDTYQSMLRQKHQTLVNITAKWKQLNDDYLTTVHNHRRDKIALEDKIEHLKLKENSCKSINSLPTPQQQTVSISLYEDVSHRLETVEEELQDARAELRTLEQRLMTAEVERASVESSLSKQRLLQSAMEESLTRCQQERAELADRHREANIEVQKLRAEHETAQMKLLAAKQERDQVEDAIEQLRSQLTKMLAQHKLLKNRNSVLEEKLNDMQDVCEKNKRLKSLSYSANASLFRRLRQERRKNNDLHKQLCQEQNRHRILAKKNKVGFLMKEHTKEVLENSKDEKCLKILEESFDEGYADSNSTLSLPPINIPSPSPLNSELLNTINDVLSRSKDFWQPIQHELDKLHAKLNDGRSIA
ncbi:major antigen-like [Phymastichus coffea]|uniref:major antigen-like n=1 Tax=Phymastichus coffea TaxID=108790 RepID=UPI00273B2B90|nr:major antigen-like [Phymastichus coffea]XP_058793606.1 major antigen-like [Phymastichus coffea]XP_058793616.1 major antigen-like [Phymastichus coffea]